MEDGLGCYLRIFNLTIQKRSEPKLTLEVTSKSCQNDFKFHISGWFGVRIENIQSDHPKEVRGQSWPRRSLQKQVEMTSNFTLLDGLGLELRIFNLTHQKRSEVKVDLRGHFKNMSKWFQISHLWMVWGQNWEYYIWSNKRGQRPKLFLFCYCWAFQLVYVHPR